MATLWVRNKPDVIKNGVVVKRRWSIIQVDKDRRGYGSKEGYHGKDSLTNGAGNYIFYRVHVPGLSPLLKPFVEREIKVDDRQYGEFKPEYQRLFPRTYYLDWEALPDWAKISLQCEGDVTLHPALAYQVLKRWDTGNTDTTLLTHFKAT